MAGHLNPDSAPDAAPVPVRNSRDTSLRRPFKSPTRDPITGRLKSPVSPIPAPVPRLIHAPVPAPVPAASPIGPTDAPQGSMVPNGSQPMPPNIPALQQKAREEAQKAASDRAKLRSRKPTDQNIPDGLEEIVHVPELVEQYKRLQAMNRELDAIMARKRLDIIDAVNRPGHVSKHATSAQLRCLTLNN